jgi:hypothetical protein
MPAETDHVPCRAQTFLARTVLNFRTILDLQRPAGGSWGAGFRSEFSGPVRLSGGRGEGSGGGEGGGASYYSRIGIARGVSKGLPPCWLAGVPGGRDVDGWLVSRSLTTIRLSGSARRGDRDGDGDTRGRLVGGAGARRRSVRWRVAKRQQKWRD